MVDCLIFTRNRPAQLDLLLRSIALFDDGMIAKPVTVLARVGSVAYATGYEIVRKDHGWVEWLIEHDLPPSERFEPQVRRWLNAGDPSRLVMFLCDDNVYYRPIVKPPPPARLPWSFRGGDYHYPFSVDGCVYRAGALRRLLAGCNFTNPTRLEAIGHAYRGRWSRPERTFTRCEPCLTNVPLNRVSVDSGMPHLGFEPEYLNLQFLGGWRLTLPPARDYPPHAEIALTIDNPTHRREVGAA